MIQVFTNLVLFMLFTVKALSKTFKFRFDLIHAIFTSYGLRESLTELFR